MERLEKIKKENSDVTVILSIFKRPYNLEEQIKAVENQTIKPKEIIVINNGCFFPTPQWVKDKYTVIENNVNFGVWFRFTVALNATTKYVNIIDDDTMPGSKWIENCLNESEKKRWLYGTIGCIYWLNKPWRAKRGNDKKERKEHYYSHTRVGWANPNKVTEEVDLIWHSRFFEKEFLSKAYFAEPMDVWDYYCWEDMRFTYTLQKYMWLWSYVPPHPPTDLEMRWSKKGWELWTKDSSWSLNGKWDNDIYDLFYQKIRKKWFRCLMD